MQRAATARTADRKRSVYNLAMILPQEDQAREIVGAATAIGRRLTNALASAGRTESTVLLEEPQTLDADLPRGVGGRPRERRRQSRIDRGPPCSPMGDGSTAGRQSTRPCGRGARPGWASKLTLATARRPTTQRESLSQGRWNRLREGRHRRSGSRFLRTPEPSSGGWLWRSPDPANSMRSRL